MVITQMLINPGLSIQIMAAAKKQTKKDLEDKIAELEAKLNHFHLKQHQNQQKQNLLRQNQAEVKPKEADQNQVLETSRQNQNQAETKPAETAKPKPTLPKGMGEKPAEAPKPQEAETEKQPPATVSSSIRGCIL